jgi:hypothetical protein
MANLPSNARSAMRHVFVGFSKLFHGLDFSNLSTGAGLNETFWLLLRVVLLFGMVLAVWAAGASVMRAEWLISPCGPWATCQAPAATVSGSGSTTPNPAPANPAAANPAAANPAAANPAAANPAAASQTGASKTTPPTLNFFQHAGLLLLQIARGVGGVEALCLAGGLIGAMLGFLFGIPQAVSGTAAANAASTNNGKTWQSNTNLTQISDWLTKVIVGVSLVTAASAWTNFAAIVNDAAASLFDSREGSPAVIGAALLGGFVLGFMFCYLYTDLVIARLIAATDKSLNAIMEAVSQQIASIGADNEVLAPRIARLPQEGTMPTVEQATAAMQLANVAVQDLTTRRDVKMWARARAVLNLFDASADGYTKLLGMPDDKTEPTDAALLIEAARVFYAAQRKAEAAVFAQLSLEELRGDAELQKNVDLKQAIVGDAVVLRLAGYVPGGYQSALDLLHEFLEDKPTPTAPGTTTQVPDNLPDDPTGRLHLLRAFANAQRYARDTSLTDPVAKERVRMQVMQDLKVVVDKGKYSKDTLREFWRPATPKEANSPERHDDLAIFGPDDPNLKSMLGAQPA